MNKAANGARVRDYLIHEHRARLKKLQFQGLSRQQTSVQATHGGSTDLRSSLPLDHGQVVQLLIYAEPSSSCS